MDVRSFLGCLFYYLLVCFARFFVSGTFLGLREWIPSVIYLLFIFAFWRLFQIHGVLLGTLFCSRECVGISGGCASVHNVPILGFQVHSLNLLFCAFLPLSPILLCSLQYINETLCTVATHPFASRAHRDKRKKLIFDHETITLADSISTDNTAGCVCPAQPL